jgi:hypothetical protein
MRCRLIWVGALLLAVSLTGCTPRVRVRSSPGPSDTGIRYYRPKPYLLVQPAGRVVREGRTSTTTPSDEFVSLTLQYLPDFSEEYAIDVRPGLGSAEVSIGLEDGWNLISVNQSLDSQVDERIEATAELADAASGFVPTSQDDIAGERPQQHFVVAATNVPLGYYESVLGKDACGKKRLYGWRYLGFLPFTACPTEMCGSQQLPCHGLPTDLFGIVFDSGVMTFRRLDQISQVADTRRVTVGSGSFVLDAPTAFRLDRLGRAVRRAVLEEFGSEAEVRARLAQEPGVVTLSIEVQGPIDERTTREELIQELMSHPAVEEALLALDNPVPSFERIEGLVDE